MDRLCDDVLHLIFDRLDYPGGLAIVNKRFYAFSQDPYVRAHYFMYRYGAIQALYYAFGRGKVLNERVLEILISSGARFSRYLVQVAFHHYFHTRSHFIKTSWVRSVPLPVFNHFLKLATDAYGDIPRGKTEDDGTVFTWFLQQTSHVDSKRVDWESLRDLLDKYKFIPFCDRDPLMSQFPLALALEPRLLPYAASNGFVMDAKYRNFIFRKMFEKASDRTADGIVENIRELCKLDSAMFVSCTVAAEVCMEATSNSQGYMALKELSASHSLIFDLRILVEDLMKQFYKPRAITHRDTQDVLRHLYRDFPSSDPTVRLVMLLTVFLPGNVSLTVSSLRDQLEELKLSPITQNDLRNLLISPWMEDFEGIVSYMRKEVISDVTGRKGMLPMEISALMGQVALRCLEIGCKGRILKKLSSIFPTVRHAIIAGVQQHVVDMDNLRTEGTRRRARYRLCRTWYQEGDDRDYFWDRAIPTQERRGSTDVEDLIPASSRQYLGPIGQESLSTMIRQEESTSQRSRRRITIEHTMLSTMTHSPFDQTHVGKWVKQEFGPRNPVTAIFLTHAIINENTSILNDYLRPERQTDTVPLTLRHFQFLARLSKAPSYLLYRYIERGGEFFQSEEEYLYLQKSPLARAEVKRESLTPPKISKPSSSSRKRPRRSTAPIVRSYADFDGCGDDPMDVECVTKRTPTVLKPVDAHLRLWIKHLRELLKMEQVQHLENKKSLLKEAEPGTKVRVSKNEFFKSLETNLRALRKLDTQRHQETLCAPEMSCSEFEDDEDYVKAGKSKRRKTTAP